MDEVGLNSSKTNINLQSGYRYENIAVNYNAHKPPCTVTSGMSHSFKYSEYESPSNQYQSANSSVYLHQRKGERSLTNNSEEVGFSYNQVFNLQKNANLNNFAS